jgi:hypothetical protein
MLQIGGLVCDFGHATVGKVVGHTPDRLHSPSAGGGTGPGYRVVDLRQATFGKATPEFTPQLPLTVWVASSGSTWPAATVPTTGWCRATRCSGA